MFIVRGKIVELNCDMYKAYGLIEGKNGEILNFIMFGAGKDALRIIGFKPIEMNIFYIVDNDRTLIGKKCGGINIFGKEKLELENRSIPILISSRKYRFEIVRNLTDLGFSNLYYIEDILNNEQLSEEI